MCIRDSGETQELRAEGRVRFTRDEVVVNREANRQVQTEYAVNSIAEAKKEAIVLADAGRKDEAAAVMRERSAGLSAMASAYSNAPMMEAAKKAAAEAEEVQAEGIDNAKRKAMSADNYKIYNQQSR